jgi:TPP-dependent 2-oxoacid decarboxylase
MSNGGGVIIVCFGVGDVTCKNTIALPHYENGIVTAAVAFPHDATPAQKKKAEDDIRHHCKQIQRVIAKVTGGDPYEFTGDPNALPECLPSP